MTYPGNGQIGGGQTGWGGQPGQNDREQSQYPTAGGFPQQTYGGEYGGLGVFFDGGEEPPKKDRKPLLIIGVVVVLLLAAGGLTTFLMSRSDDEQPVANSTPAPTSTGESADPGPITECKPRKTSWECLPVEELSYSYDTPEAWTPKTGGSAEVEGMPGVRLVGLTVYGDYACGDRRFNRGSTGGVVVPQTDLAAIGKDFALKLSDQYYRPFASTYAAVVGEPKKVTIPFTNDDGKTEEITGVQVDSLITTSGNACLATKGMIKILVLKGNKGSHVFMANGDVEGGPASPAPVAEGDLQAMVDSVKPLTRG